MKYFKITRTWSVKAEDEPEAFRQIVADPNEHLESEAVTRTEYKKAQAGDRLGGWDPHQLVGSNSQR